MQCICAVIHVAVHFILYVAVEKHEYIYVCLKSLISEMEENIFLEKTPHFFSLIFGVSSRSQKSYVAMVDFG